MKHEIRVIDLLDAGCTPAFLADVMHNPFLWVTRYVDVLQEPAEKSADIDIILEDMLS